MKDTQKPLRHAMFNLLSGAITYDGNAVGVYDEMNDSDDIYIVLSTQQETFDETSDTFITRSAITLEIVAKTGTTVSKDIVDDISDDIYTLLRPTTSTTGLVNPSGFQINNVFRESANTQVLQITATQSIVRKLITIVVTITEQ
jgi:hypothetical protein